MEITLAEQVGAFVKVDQNILPCSAGLPTLEAREGPGNRDTLLAWKRRRGAGFWLGLLRDDGGVDGLVAYGEHAEEGGRGFVAERLGAAELGLDGGDVDDGEVAGLFI